MTAPKYVWIIEIKYLDTEWEPSINQAYTTRIEARRKLTELNNHSNTFYYGRKYQIKKYVRN